mgnify:CR=1 FL=1
MAQNARLLAGAIHHGGRYSAGGGSAVDDQGDRDVLPCIFAAVGQQHGTAVMLPNGFIFARVYGQDGRHSPVDLVSVAGDQTPVLLWGGHPTRGARPVALSP